jgi:tRNA nucleotidyltransferase (CCA-adding enzyme)
MHLPPDLLTVLDAVRQSGGRPRLVGGCVRDWLLGLNAKDYDVEVGGLGFESLHRILSPWGATNVVGRSFGVIKLRLASAEYDFSLPRRESKIGAGHRGFHVHPEPNLSDDEAAARRDFTINSISYDPISGELFDPHGGEQDLRAGILRHTSPAFVEDPLRVLRAMQFAGRFDLKLAPETAALCAEIADTYAELPKERVWGEWDKWATQSKRPSRGIVVLTETGWLKHFPEIACMRGTPQDPEWHPEGDVLEHTKYCLDALVQTKEWPSWPTNRRRILSFAVLAHDFGKPSTTTYMERRREMRWCSFGHEAAGGPPAESFMQRIGAPRELHEPVRALVIHHLLHHPQEGPGYTDSQIRRLARRLAPATIDDLCEVMKADANGRPPLSNQPSLRLLTELRDRAHELSLGTEQPRAILLGRHLITLGLNAGPEFKPLLDEAFEAQLEGLFSDEAGALDWLKQRLERVSAKKT